MFRRLHPNHIQSEEERVSSSKNYDELIPPNINRVEYSACILYSTCIFVVDDHTSKTSSLCALALASQPASPPSHPKCVGGIPYTGRRWLCLSEVSTFDTIICMFYCFAWNLEIVSLLNYLAQAIAKVKSFNCNLVDTAGEEGPCSPSPLFIWINGRLPCVIFPESIRPRSTISSRSGLQRFSTIAVASHAPFCSSQARRCLDMRNVEVMGYVPIRQAKKEGL